MKNLREKLNRVGFVEAKKLSLPKGFPEKLTLNTMDVENIGLPIPHFTKQTKLGKVDSEEFMTTMDIVAIDELKAYVNGLALIYNAVGELLEYADFEYDEKEIRQVIWNDYGDKTLMYITEIKAERYAKKLVNSVRRDAQEGMVFLKNRKITGL